jgi:parallel beta-helix repeat protein
MQCLSLIVIVAAAFGVGATAQGGEAATPPIGDASLRCDDVLALGGDAAAFVSDLGPGETGCLREGVHTVTDGPVAIGAPGAVLSSYPGESATLAGRLWVKPSADRAVVQDLTLDGRNPMGKPSPTINADEVVLRGNDISNDHTEICVSVNNYEGEPPPRGVVIESNFIHDCGQLPPTNHHHGVYVANARDTVVKGNVIYSNADRGVQLYPDADGSLVIGNIIDNNGSGVIFGGGPSSSSDDNLVAANVITGSRVRFNVESHWQGPVGEGNAAFGNCLWTTSDDHHGSPARSGLEAGMPGVVDVGNVVADPDYSVPQAGSFEIGADLPCTLQGVAGG